MTLTGEKTKRTLYMKSYFIFLTTSNIWSHMFLSFSSPSPPACGLLPALGDDSVLPEELSEGVFQGCGHHAAHAFQAAGAKQLVEQRTKRHTKRHTGYSTSILPRIPYYDPVQGIV